MPLRIRYSRPMVALCSLFSVMIPLHTLFMRQMCLWMVSTHQLQICLRWSKQRKDVQLAAIPLCVAALLLLPAPPWTRRDDATMLTASGMLMRSSSVARVALRLLNALRTSIFFLASSFLSCFSGV